MDWGMFFLIATSKTRDTDSILRLDKQLEQTFSSVYCNASCLVYNARNVAFSKHQTLILTFTSQP
jgi:hypothetical protein